MKEEIKLEIEGLPFPYLQTANYIAFTSEIRFLCQILLSFVTISTLTVWSKAPQTHSPFLSGLQSRLEMGCVDRVTFCKRLTDPATPISDPSESFFERCAGYSLPMRKVKQKQLLRNLLIQTHHHHPLYFLLYR